MASATGNDRAHALYAPSAAHRWMVCPASVKATAGMFSPSSVYAAEGTVAHDVLERSIMHMRPASHYIGDIVDVEIEGKPSSLIVTKEMAEAVQVCLDYLQPIIAAADEYHAEQRVTLELFGAAGCYGTSDFTAIVSVAGRIIVVDYKHGAGVSVDVVDNPQLKIYALGTLLKLGKLNGITHIQTTIVQPRYPHADGPVRSNTYTLAELMDFGADVLAAIERCEEDNPPFVPGDHCTWCGIEDTCAARAKSKMHIVAVINELEDGMTLSVDERERLLEEFDRIDIEAFIASLRAGLHKYAEEGGTLTRHKLVPKRPSRVWLKDESYTLSALRPILDKKGAAITDAYEMKLKSPAQMEKIVGKAVAVRAVMEGLTASVSSGTNLVPIDDPRREAKVSAEDEFDSFCD